MSRGGIWNSWTSDSNGVFRFLNKKEKIKEKKRKKKSELSSSNEDETTSADTKDSNSIDLPMNGADSDQPVVDDEGYIIRPKPNNKPVSDNHFYSSSDSDSEEEEKDHKIRIKIKPLTNGVPISASVEELIASAGTLSLSPITQHSNRRIYTTTAGQLSKDAPMKRSISVNHNISKTENDLISVFSPLSSASFSLGLTDQNQTNCKNHSSNYKLNSTNNNNQKNPTTDRYAALSDLFSEPSSESPTLPKSMSASVLGPPLSTSIPRPPSKRNPQTSPQLCHQNSQSSTMSRCQSATSLSSDFKMTPISVGYSRGPSPITLGISDTIPIAIALQESVSACFKGSDESKCRVQVIGCLKMAFPAGIVQALANNPYVSPLTFRLNKLSKLEKIIPNKELLSDNSSNSHLMTDSSAFEVNMSALMSNIRRLYEQSPNSRYYNIDLMKYQMRCIEGAKNTPLQLVSYWKCDPNFTCLKVDYKFNSSVIGQSQALRNVVIGVTVDGEPHSMKCRPEGKWNSSTKQAIWRFDQISKQSESGGLGSIKAKFDLSSGPSKPSPIQAQFACNDSILTGIDFELTAMAYRISLVKKQIFAGRYVCEP